jgi:hypothetical protein
MTIVPFENWKNVREIHTDRNAKLRRKQYIPDIAAIMRDTTRIVVGV